MTDRTEAAFGWIELLAVALALAAAALWAGMGAAL